MAIATGDKLPDVTLKTLTERGIEEVSTAELCRGKTVVLFAVPGAFTPTCSDAHLPGFLNHADELKAKGAGVVACVAVNDPFVMAAWAKARGVGDRLLMLSDGNGELAEAMDLVLDASRFHMGRRSRRWAAIVDDGVVRYLGVEPGGEVGVSGAEAVLAAL
ncbi:MAG: peroxiredoxin [Acidobacteria bacterium]|nr:MAG: peroxiredoxin [Acidobacteriota bacterium]